MEAAVALGPRRLLAMGGDLLGGVEGDLVLLLDTLGGGTVDDEFLELRQGVAGGDERARKGEDASEKGGARSHVRDSLLEAVDLLWDTALGGNRPLGGIGSAESLRPPL